MEYADSGIHIYIYICKNMYKGDLQKIIDNARI